MALGCFCSSYPPTEKVIFDPECNAYEWCNKLLPVCHSTCRSDIHKMARRRRRGAAPAVLPLFLLLGLIVGTAAFSFLRQPSLLPPLSSSSSSSTRNSDRRRCTFPSFPSSSQPRVLAQRQQTLRMLDDEHVVDGVSNMKLSLYFCACHLPVFPQTSCFLSMLLRNKKGLCMIMRKNC